MLSVNFAPENSKQVKALLKYIEDNRSVIDNNKTAEYTNEVLTVKSLMRDYYDRNPAQLIVKECPWKLTGATAKCEAIARKYSVPYWDVVADANPAM